MVRVDLERKIETLREELEYNRKVHNEEMEDLKEQISSQESIIKNIVSLPIIFSSRNLKFLSKPVMFHQMYQMVTKSRHFPGCIRILDKCQR